MLRLLAGASAERRRALRAALFRLTDASAMGELFKVLVLARPGAPLPPGFHAPTLLPGQSRA
jgi:SAM-dependent MidA family methyltransferase